METRGFFLKKMILLVVGALFFGGPILLYFLPSGKMPQEGSGDLPGDRPADDFSLLDHWSTPTKLKDFQGKVVLLLFGYTYCPDICPTQLESLRELMKELGDLAGELQVLFVTVDPERDKPKVLREYLENFHSSFLGLTGSKEEISRMIQHYHGRFSKGEEMKGGYKMDHSSTFSLIHQRGGLFGIYPHDIPPKKLAEEVVKAIDSRGL